MSLFYFLLQSCFAANFIHSELTVGHAFITEFILTFFLMFVVMAACDSNKSNQTLVPFAIGMAVLCAHMVGLPITGCSINPTRSFASAAAASGVCDGAWDGHWVFWVSQTSKSAPSENAKLVCVLLSDLPYTIIRGCCIVQYSDPLAFWCFLIRSFLFSLVSLVQFLVPLLVVSSTSIASMRVVTRSIC